MQKNSCERLKHWVLPVLLVVWLAVAAAGTAQATNIGSNTPSLSMSATSGGAPASQVINISSDGAPLSFIVQTFVFTPSNVNWLKVDKLSGTTPASITVTANPLGLGVTNGILPAYSATITVTSSGAANSPLSIPVTFDVFGTRQLAVDSLTVNFQNVTAGTVSTAQMVGITAVGAQGGELIYSASATSGGNWLSVNPPSGLTPRVMNVTADATNLTPGSYQGVILINDTTNSVNTLIVIAVKLQVVGSSQFSYYFAHIAAAQAWRTTFTYVNTSAVAVSCNTFFFSDGGNPLPLSFGGVALISTSDAIPAGGVARRQTDLQTSSPLVTGWARADCTGPVKASALFRSHNGTVPQAEASVLAMTAPATSFVTYSDQLTGLAYANPSSSPAQITFTAKNATGGVIASGITSLNPGAHGQANVGPLLGIANFQGSITLSSTMPIISLSLNFEAAPVFSTLPPGQPDGTPVGATTYYFAHIAAAEAWRTTFTYVNTSAVAVTCNTFFFSGGGNPLPLSFGGIPLVSTSDTIPAGGVARRQTDLQTASPLVTGWARADCTGPVKASALFRSHNGSVPQAEASVLAMTAPATSFVTYSDQLTGLAYANPSGSPAQITFTAKNATGAMIASGITSLNPGAHGQANVGPLLGIANFQGSITLSSTVPIISLSLNFEAAPVFSALPPGQ